MKVGHAGSIRVLTIIALVFSCLMAAISVLGYLLVMGMFDISVGFLSDALLDMADDIDELADYANASSGMISWLIGRFLIGGFRPGILFFGYFLILAVITGVMCVLILTCAGHTDRYGNLSIWAIVGAIAAIASLRILSFAFFIIVMARALCDRRRFAHYPAPVEMPWR